MMPVTLDTHNFTWFGELFHWSDAGFYVYRSPGWSRRCRTAVEAVSEAAT